MLSSVFYPTSVLRGVRGSQFFCLNKMHSTYLVKKLIKTFWYEVGNLLLDKLHNNDFTFFCESLLVHFFVARCQDILRAGPMIVAK